MHIDGWTLLLQAVNFLILVWLLRRFLYRPVLAVIAERQVATERVRSEAEAARQTAEAARQSLEEQRTALPAERDRLIAAARAEAEAERAALLEKARVDADHVLEEARKRLSDERAQALEALQSHAADLGTQLATRLLRDVPAGSLTCPLLDEACAAVEALNGDQRHALVDGINPVTVRLAMAAPLAESDTARTRDRLAAAFGRPVALELVEDPSLIAGVELHFAHSIVRRSWKQALAEAMEEMTRHDSAGNTANAVA
jgi:F-type H+-transporting ATPase subunit b